MCLCQGYQTVHVSVKGVILCQSVSVMGYASVSVRGINMCQQSHVSVSVRGMNLCQSVSVSVSQCK